MDATTARLIDRFLEMMAAERGAARNTLAAYRRDLADHAGQLASRDRLALEAGRADLSASLAAWAAAGLSPRSQARKLSALRQFYGFLCSEGLRCDDPSQALDSPRRGRPLPKILALDEVDALFAALAHLASPEQERMTAQIEILYSAGLRVSELVALPLDAVGRGQSAPVIRGKGERERMIPLTAAARDAIDAWIAVRSRIMSETDYPTAARRFLFPAKRRAGHVSRNAFYLALKNLAVRAGLDPSRVSPHVLRHAFASHMLQNGADLRVLQTLLGHADIATTQIYTHVDTRQLADLVESCHPLARIQPDKG